jgi:hypothetical protein
MNFTQRVHNTAPPETIPERLRAGGLKRVQTQHNSNQRRPDLLKRQQRGAHRPIRFSKIPVLRRLPQARRKRSRDITTGEVAANG